MWFRELGIRRYVLVGHSMGGKVAQLAASRRPDGLGGLVAPAPPRPAVDAQAADALSHAYDSPMTVSDALQHVLAYRPLAAGLRQQVITDSLAAGRNARLAWPLHGITEDITTDASAIEVPVQVVAGQRDRVEPPASLEANLLPFIPGARISVIEGTGHLSPLEVPGQITNQLDQFAASLAPRATDATRRQNATLTVPKAASRSDVAQQTVPRSPFSVRLTGHPLTGQGFGLRRRGLFPVISSTTDHRHAAALP